MKKMLSSLICVVTLVALSGCANLRVGTNFNPALAESEIRPNITTRAQVRGLLGAPLRSHSAGEVTIDVHKWVTPRQFACVYVSYRGDTVMHVTRLR